MTNKYTNLSPLEKIQYNLTNLEEEIARLGIDTSCMASRKVCIDCSLQEIANSLAILGGEQGEQWLQSRFDKKQEKNSGL